MGFRFQDTYFNSVYMSVYDRTVASIAPYRRFMKEPDQVFKAIADHIKEGGALVARNISYPLKFSEEMVQELGFVHIPVAVPFLHPNFGGRTAVWPRQ